MKQALLQYYYRCLKCLETPILQLNTTKLSFQTALRGHSQTHWSDRLDCWKIKKATVAVMISRASRTTLDISSRSEVAALNHVSRTIASYLDGSVMIPLNRACSSEPIQLLDRIWNSEPTADKWTSWPVPANGIHYQYQSTKSLTAAVKRGDLDIVNWILDRFREAQRHSRSWKSRRVTVDWKFTSTSCFITAKTHEKAADVMFCGAGMARKMQLKLSMERLHVGCTQILPILNEI